MHGIYSPNLRFGVTSNIFCIFSPVDEHKNRRWLKRKALHQPGVTNLKKVKSSAPTANENELGIVKIEHDDCSPLEDSTQESADSASTSHGNSFLGFGDEIIRNQILQGYTPNKKETPLLISKFVISVRILYFMWLIWILTGGGNFHHNLVISLLKFTRWLCFINVPRFWFLNFRSLLSF